MSTKRDYRSFDVLLVLMVCAMVVMGIVLIGSAISSMPRYSHLHTQQKIFFATGFVLMLAGAFVDYHFIAKFYIPIYIFNLMLLVIVFFLPGEMDTTNTARWINLEDILPISVPFNIQPSEFTKLFMIICLAQVIEKYGDRINKLSVLALVLLGIALPVVLIFAQPSLSASIVVLVIAVVMLYTSGLHYRYIVIAIVIFVPLIGFVLIDALSDTPLIIDKILEGFHIKRIRTFFNPDPNDWSYWQTKQSITAIQSGLMYGMGLYNGHINQTPNMLPYNYNDFIFAVVGEELGFAGCVAVLAVMLLIITKCLLIAQKATDTLGRQIATGVAIMLAFQTIANVGVAIGMLPNTGMPFPFLSYGGSSMWINFTAIGLVLNVRMTKHKTMFESP